MTKVKNRIIEPTLKGLQEENIPYFGFIFIGLMKVGDDPFVIEYNCRMGDPETEAVLPRIKSDLVETILNLNKGKVTDFEIIPNTAATLVLTSGGYPEGYHKGKTITGVDKVKDALVFHSGTKINRNALLSNGGRVIAITALGNSIDEARNVAYEAAITIHFEGMHYRKDIGLDLID
jgi:phosphoribosylamine--glycine ligase